MDRASGHRRISNSLFFKHRPARGESYSPHTALLSFDFDVYRGQVLPVRAYARTWSRSRRWCRARVLEYIAAHLAECRAQPGPLREGQQELADAGACRTCAQLRRGPYANAFATALRRGPLLGHLRATPWREKPLLPAVVTSAGPPGRATSGPLPGHSLDPRSRSRREEPRTRPLFHVEQGLDGVWPEVCALIVQLGGADPGPIGGRRPGLVELLKSIEGASNARVLIMIIWGWWLLRGQKSDRWDPLRHLVLGTLLRPDHVDDQIAATREAWKRGHGPPFQPGDHLRRSRNERKPGEPGPLAGRAS